MYDASPIRLGLPYLAAQNEEGFRNLTIDP
jgi:hypothetical protein